MDSNILAFDRTGEQLLPIATIIRESTPEHADLDYYLEVG